MNTLLQLGVLLDSLQGVQGRKKLQKIVHILQEFGVPFFVQFGYKHYGPYSEALQECLQSYKQDGLLEETPITDFYPSSRFTITGKLRSLIDVIPVSRTPNWLPLAQSLNSKSARELEAVSTLLFLKNQFGTDKGSLEKAFLNLKPNLKDVLKQSEQFISELEGVRA